MSDRLVVFLRAWVSECYFILNISLTTSQHVEMDMDLTFRKSVVGTYYLEQIWIWI